MVHQVVVSDALFYRIKVRRTATVLVVAEEAELPEPLAMAMRFIGRHATVFQGHD